MLIFQIVLTAMQLTQKINERKQILLSNGKFVRPEDAKIKVSKLSHRLGRQGISYYCELDKVELVWLLLTKKLMVEMKE